MRKVCLAAVLSLLCVSNAFAGTAGINMVEQEKSNINDTETEEEQELKYYFSDEEFEEYVKYMLTEAENRQEAAMKLYLFIVTGGASKEQAVSVLEKGYFTEFIDDLKSVGAIPEDYVLPDTIQPIPAAMASSEPYEAPEPVEVKERYEELDEKAEKAFRQFCCDEEDENAGLNISAGAEDKTISGNILSLSFYNAEPSDINFITEDGFSDVSWHFGNVLVRENDKVNLAVDHDEEHIEFHLGRVRFPYPAQVMIRMDSPDSKYNLYEKDGKFRETLISDRRGYITMAVSGNDASCVVAKEVVSTEAAGREDKEEVKVEKPRIQPIDLGWLQKGVSVLFVLTVGLFLWAYITETRRH